MTKKDYAAITNILREEREKTSYGIMGRRIAVDSITRSLADVFAQDTPRFDRSKFYAAVGVDPPKEE
jgi:hypothetical protein